MLQRRDKHLTIPANLDLEQLLTNNPPESPGINQDYLACICNEIIKLKVSSNDQYRKGNQMVKLYSLILHEKMYSYRACLDYLIQAKVILCDNSYILGVESMGYDFTEIFIGAGFKDYIVKNPWIKRRWLNQDDLRREERSRKLNSVQHLVQFFNEKLVIDKEGARKWIADNLGASLDYITDTVLDSTKREFELIHTLDNHDLYQLMAQRLVSRDFHFLVDDSGHRFHSPLTNMKGKLRNFLTYDGKELVSLDIKNCQPYLSCLLFQLSFYDNNTDAFSLKKIYPELYTILKKNGYLDLLRGYAKGVSGISKRYISIEEYRKQVLDGSFYEKFAELIAVETHGNVTPDRDQSKDYVFQIFFGKNDPYHLRRINRVFQKYYPDVASIFSMFKKKEHRDLALVLQRIESEVVLNVITKRFNAIFPEVPLFTIHDCIITETGYKDQLKEIMEEETRRIISAPPRIKEEYWKPDNAIIELPELPGIR